MNNQELKITFMPYEIKKLLWLLSIQIIYNCYLFKVDRNSISPGNYLNNAIIKLYSKGLLSKIYIYFFL